MHNKVKRIAAALLSVVMVLSVFGGMSFTASASRSRCPTPDAEELRQF